MSLVSYLKALCSRFYSKNESELVGHQAMPSSSWLTISDLPSAQTSVTSFVAPSDGYVYYGSKGESGANIEINYDSGSMGTRNFCGTSTGRVYIPVRKGQKVNFSCYKAYKEPNARFWRTVGGGINRLFRYFKGACYA